MNLPLQIFAANSPVPYALSAALVTVLVLLGGYLYYKFEQMKLQYQLAKCRNNAGENSAAVQDISEDELKTDDKQDLPCSNIPGKIKKIQQKRLQKEMDAEMTEEEKMKERNTQREQLTAIFELMQQQEDKFGVASAEEIQDQMRLYTQ